MMNDLERPLLEPVTQAFLDTLAQQNPPPISSLTYAEARNVLEDAQSGNAAMAPVVVEDHLLPGGHASITVYRPQGPSAPIPAVMYFHGGGWILGSRETHARLLRDLTAATGVAFVFLNYTPSPEMQYPVPLEQAYTATSYIAEHGKSLGLDPRRLAVAGDSVGANMATAVALIAKRRRGPDLCCQALFYPVTDARMDTESYRTFAEGPWLTRRSMEWFWNAYAPNPADRSHPLTSPLQAPLDQLEDLPPALIITAENDVLRDEGEAYARRLISAGVEVTSVRYLGTIHDFMMLNALSKTPATRSAIELAAMTLRRSFGPAIL